MAYTKIHPIKTTVNKAITYICNPNKTDEKILISSYACSPETAAMDFKFTLSKTSSADINKAYHLIQSFVPGEVTYDMAHQVGQELADRLLKNKYSYIVSTHIDKEHIHNHIIFCAADNFEHKKYHDCKTSYYHIRNLSDKLCEEYGLSVIKECKNIAKSYKEWNENKNGFSWKSQIKKDINATIKVSNSYEEFLSIMRSKGYEIENESLDPNVTGKYIKFKHHSSQVWVRGRPKTLGPSYTKESIYEQITNKALVRTKKMVKQPSKRLIDTSDTIFQESIGLSRWAKKENLKRVAHTYALLNEKGFHSIEELNDTIASMQQQMKDNKKDMVASEKHLKSISELYKYAAQYMANRLYHDKYLKAKNKELVSQKYATQLTLYGGAKNMLEKAGIHVQNLDISKLQENYQVLTHNRQQLQAKNDKINKELKELLLLQENMKAYMSPDTQKFVENSRRKAQELE
ncbi:MAG: relaxase/mobilization nuclease domain-containing protein [Agathobacter sp.]|nr:relaxase/mobilization nuclease domain-containing protein [Agathobacter sp.]